MMRAINRLDFVILGALLIWNGWRVGSAEVAIVGATVITWVVGCAIAASLEAWVERRMAMKNEQGRR